MSDDPASKDGLIWEMQQQIERLTRERDDARREILESIHPDDRRAYAEARGWDCFKEKTS